MGDDECVWVVVSLGDWDVSDDVDIGDSDDSDDSDGDRNSNIGDWILDGWGGVMEMSGLV